MVYSSISKIFRLSIAEKLEKPS